MKRSTAGCEVTSSNTWSGLDQISSHLSPATRPLSATVRFLGMIVISEEETSTVRASRSSAGFVIACACTTLGAALGCHNLFLHTTLEARQHRLNRSMPALCSPLLSPNSQEDCKTGRVCWERLHRGLCTPCPCRHICTSGPCFPSHCDPRRKKPSTAEPLALTLVTSTVLHSLISPYGLSAPSTAER